MTYKRSVNTNKGKIDVSQLNTPPEKHEFETAKFFSLMGKDVTFIKPSNIPGVHTPDIIMDGVEWEIKCPVGSSKRTISDNFKTAVKQSKYIVFDLRRVKLSEKQCVSQLEKEFSVRPYLRRLLIICKSGKLLEYT